ncbi:MAG: diguanylate cyclase [bacterium]|nr:diguanylate cyclase [bacterium]
MADDNVESASVLCEGLKLHGYSAFQVDNGTDALEACVAGKADLVLLDVCMPGMDGYDVCRQLKASPNTKDIAVIFVTVKGDQDDIALGYSLGAADWITKPYNLPMVMLRVDAAMRGKAASDEANGEPDSLTDSAYTDHLTGLRNRRFLLERLEEEVDEAHRHSYPVSCVMFDVSEVNALDEELGPVSIDDLLAELAMSVRNYSRLYDVVARYDGTMFATVLPHAPLEQAVDYAGKILREVDATTFSDPSFPTNVKLNAGIVTCKNGSARGADYVLGEAMRGLLQAKSKADAPYVARNLE